MKCTCGYEITVDTENRDKAVEKIKAIMTPDAIAKHMLEKHANQPVPSNEQVFAMIEQVNVAH